MASNDKSSTHRPTGTVTFLFTDIEGSTGRWEAQTAEMQAALARHDDDLRTAIEAHGGWLFKHTGDGVLAAFSSPNEAVHAAIEAQRALDLPVRMGVATGEAERRGDDYFGPTLNRAARIMAAGHGGQVLLAQSTASMLAGIDLLDLGERRLRDLSGAQRIFQVRGGGLREQFPPLRTVDTVPGNLPAQQTSFVGRETELTELVNLVRAHRLVTLTGVGGVGKTRLAVQVAAELVPDFADGVWLVELAPVGDPAAVPDAMATALGVTPQAGLTVSASIAQALFGRRLLIVLDNCEHLLDAAADLVETILARASTVKVIATSREGLRLGAEHLWPVPSLDLGGGVTSAAVELFVERARAVTPGFALKDEADVTATTEICRRLDGIPLAIELAAARMVSMSVQDVRDRLGDRFRLLAGGRRGLERHQTLRHAVGWSYDLFGDDERTVLNRCSVFAGGFSLASATHLCDGFDEYTVLDLLDSLVRKSLVTVERAGGHARYGMLETIRQFAEDQLAAMGAIGEVRDRHARYFAAQAVAYWEIWNGPGCRVAIDWVDAELANLRAGFRWAADEGDLATAAAIAAHAAMMAWALNRLEPVGWIEELLPATTAADLAQLPRLYTAASFLCSQTGRQEVALGYAETAVALAADPHYRPFEAGWPSLAEAAAHIYAGRIERWLEICTAFAAQTGLAHVMGLVGLTFGLSAVGRSAEAMAIADEALAAARADGGPYWIAFAFQGYGRAFTETDPLRALDAFRQGLTYSREHRFLYWEGVIAREAAGLEASHGDLEQGLLLFGATLDSFQQAGHVTELAAVLAAVVRLFNHLGQPEIAATIYGIAVRQVFAGTLVDLARVAEHLRSVLGESRFDECVAAGATMELGDAVRYARQQIQTARAELVDTK
jgi:predicted ATPase/class 3 adenylate cyclase